MLATALSLRSLRWLSLVVVGIGVALCFVPLTGVHGAESAVALGALLPPLAAALGARLCLAVRQPSHPPTSAFVLARAAALGGLWLWALPTAVLALDAFRIRNCAPAEGFAFMVLGPGVGAVLAALCGACWAAARMPPRLSTTLATLTPVAFALFAISRFYTTPAVFAYGHFFGYFPGTIYDERVTLPDQLLVLRVVTSCFALGLLSLLLGHYRPADRRLSVAPVAGGRGWSGLAVVCMLLVVAAGAYAPELGHASSAELIVERLGQRVLSERCELVVPRELPRVRVDRLAHDCDLRVDQAERFLGLGGSPRVRVYLFRNAGEKHVLMGAAGTNVAKPWRNEVYLHDRGWPHPVLAHEIAHVVAARTGIGPFRVTGPLGGFLPDFALVEGVAVATAWADSSGAGLTPHQWSRAMVELDMAPALTDVLGVGFFRAQKRMAYTVVGSLLRFVADTRGRQALGRIYRAGDMERALGVPLATLEKEWRRFLTTVPLPAEAKALAQVRFAGGSIFSRVCPHQVAALKGELGEHLAAGNDAEATDTCRRILDIDGADTPTRAALVQILARAGDESDADTELAHLVGPPSAAPLVIDQARHGLADEAWRAGRAAEALAAYRALLDEPAGDDARRLLQVKQLALEGSAREARLVFELLVGEPGRRVDGATAVYLARELRAERDDGLPQYLESRQLFFQERFDHAAALMAEARELGLPTVELAREARRVHAVALFGAGELEASARLWRDQRGTEGPALQAQATDWLQRIRHAQLRAAAF